MNRDSNPDLLLNSTFIPLCHNTDLSVPFFSRFHLSTLFLPDWSELNAEQQIPSWLYLLDQSGLQFFERTPRILRKENANKEILVRVKCLECNHKDNALIRRQNISLKNGNEHIIGSAWQWPLPSEMNIVSGLFSLHTTDVFCGLHGALTSDWEGKSGLVPMSQN